MTDLDTKLRDVAHWLVANPPAPPDFHALPVSTRRPRVLVLAAAAAAIVGVLGIRVVANDNTSTVRAGNDVPPNTSIATDHALSCSKDPPLNVLVPSAAGGPIAMPAPGHAPALAGQRVMHFAGSDAVVELRWPAGPQLDYAPAPVTAARANAAEHVAPARVEVDVEPLSSSQESGSDTFAPDLVLEAHADGAMPPEPCDTMEIAVETRAGRWATALRVRPVDERLAPPYESYDNDPLVGSRQAVKEPPPVIPCEGAGRPGVAAYRSGAAERLSKDAPLDVLRHHLANTTGSPRSNWVEMTISESRVIYGAEFGAGWTVLVEATGDDAGWHLGGWRSSGC